MQRPIKIANPARAAVEAVAWSAAVTAAKTAAKAVTKSPSPSPAPAAPQSVFTPAPARQQTTPASRNASQTLPFGQQTSTAPLALTSGINPADFLLNGITVPQENDTPPPYIPTNNVPVSAEEADETEASAIVDQMTSGQSIDQIAEDRGLTRQQILDTLESGGMTVDENAPTSDNGDVQTTAVTLANGETVSEYYDYQHDAYHTELTGADGEPVDETPMRDGSGRAMSTSYDAETGQTSTIYEDDLGDGTVTEDILMPDGTSVETVVNGTDATGAGIVPITTVTVPGGQPITLDSSQDPGGQSTQAIQDALAEGQSIDQIAENRELTPEQVRAELQAAGYTVETTDPSSDNGDVQNTTLTNAHTGEEIAYTRDWQHDVTTTTSTDGDMVTTHSETGDGVVTDRTENTSTGEVEEVVFDSVNQIMTTTTIDADGRETVKTDDIQGDGEPNEYVVEEGDNLTAIAEANGMTLDELQELNPGFFAGRDPDFINPGEIVMVNDPVETTVAVTFNGYEVTTAPNGEVTVNNLEDNYSVTFEEGSAGADMALLVTEVDRNSDDPEEAMQAEVTLNQLDSYFASEAALQIQQDLDLQEVEGLGLVSANTRAAVDEYGSGVMAQPSVDEDGVPDPVGERPEDVPGNWVPIDWQGTYRWVAPEVADALTDDAAAMSKLGELSSMIDVGGAQADVYALDPAYNEAREGAEDLLNERLNPHGYEVTLGRPDMTAEDAQARLDEAEAIRDEASEVAGLYEEANSVLDEAIEANNVLSTTTPVEAPGADNLDQVEGTQTWTDAYQNEEYANYRAQVADTEALFGQYNQLIAQGDRGSIDLAVMRNEAAGIDANSPEHQALLDMQEGFATRAELAEAYSQYLDAESELRNYEAETAQQLRQMFDEWNSTSGDTPTYVTVYATAEGQGMLDLYYDEATFEAEYGSDRAQANVTSGQSIRLSVFGTENETPPDWINADLNDAWNAHHADGQGEGVHGGSFITARENAAARWGELQAGQLDATIEQYQTDLTDLNAAYDTLLTEHGPGTAELPEGAFPDGIEPVTVEVAGQDILVTPEAKEQIEAGNWDGVIEAGAPVRLALDVDGDGETEERWVAPELALVALQIQESETQIGSLQGYQDYLNGWAGRHRDDASNPYNYYAADNADYEALTGDEGNALDANFQHQFQAFHEQGYDGSFNPVSSGDLDQTVADALGLDPEDEQHAEIIDSVTEAIQEEGGENPELAMSPIFHVDRNGTTQTMLFAVHNSDGETVYIDITGKTFTSVEDFQDHNDQFSEEGRIVFAENFDMTAGEDGQVNIDAGQARNMSFLESTVDPAVGVITAVATVGSFIPGVNVVAAPIAIAGGFYLGGRAVANQYEHISHGGEWNDTQSVMNMVGATTAVLPGASGVLRTIGMVRAGLPGGTAAMASIGAVGRNSAYADDVAGFMGSGAMTNRIAYGADVASLASGTPALVVSGYDLAVNGGEMSGLELAGALANLGVGVLGTGMGIRGLRVVPGSTVPGSSGAPGTTAPSGEASRAVPEALVADRLLLPVPEAAQGAGAPALDPAMVRPAAVHELGPDGVYHPTGEVVDLGADGSLIAGETIDAGGSGRGGDESEPVIIVEEDAPGSASTGQPAIDAAPNRLAIEAAPVNEFTLDQLFHMSTAERGAAAETYIRRLHNSSEHNILDGTDASFAVPQNTGLKVRSRRDVDAAVENRWTQIIQALEVKNWRLWANRGNGNERQEVPLSSHIQEQINADIALRDARSDYLPRWIFIDAPPSPALLTALNAARIPANIYGRVPPLVDGSTYVPGPDNNLIAARLDPSLGRGSSDMIRLNPNYVYRPGADGVVPTASALRNSGKLGVLITDADGPVVVALGDARLPGRSETQPAATQKVTPVANAPEGYLAIEASPPLAALEPAAEPNAATSPESGTDGAVDVAAGNEAPAGHDEDISLSPDQLKALDSRQLWALSAEQVAMLSPERLEGIAPGKIGKLDPAGVAQWNTAQIEALSPRQVSRLSVDQIKAMSAEQLSRFSDDQWSSLNEAQGKALTSEQLVLVSEDHYARIPDKALSKIHPDAIGRQDVQYISDYSADKLKALSFEQIRSLSPEQVAAIDPVQLGRMRADHIRKFSAEQFTWMTPRQRAALSTEQVLSLRNTNKNTLTETQKATLSAREQKALLKSRNGSLTNEQAQLFRDTLKAAKKRELGYFASFATGTTAGIGLVHATLPPELSAPVAAAGLLVRGSVTAAQGMFKNATYDNTMLGRILNGVAGASYLATGQAGLQNPAASAPSLATNFLNSPKGMIRSVTGQTMLRTWSTRVTDPAAVGVGVNIMVNNPDNPVAFGAGALISLANTESIIRGIRTERVWNMPHPTDKQGADELEASNKRWDRSKFAAGFVGLVGAGGVVTTLLTKDDPQNADEPDLPTEAPGPSTILAPSADPVPLPPIADSSTPAPSDPNLTQPWEMGAPQMRPEPAPTYSQFMVEPAIGLNLRSEPDADAMIVTAFSPGTVLDQIGEVETDADGRRWTPVEGVGQDGAPATGWVASEYITSHTA
ncbi:LysM peptidoglycan-binding domain-containing protein [Phyllobacterium sp. 21LDTY02-6]|uniref:SH3 domain-containing protein n=1 Tax=Phyllobacterium sp. 21LDTY02-6 TaxID=2944903 RepID=UPI002022623A|nr:SH3 domain-containing protein [Phyllobacterium sp. 21LDTY02-6]MCO4318083.1 LysM peptidoglycan-binding domain-containing protein [Phyllobacterium sp. 21LDTY02-6]